MKKVLSLVLTLSLVLGTFSMAFAATKFGDVKGENCEDAVNVLTELGVVTGYEDGTYKPENIVTRAEMAVLVVNALGLEDYVTDSATSSFTDMDGYGWAQGYIAYAQSLGVISGYGDGTFKPGKTVSYDEAATMLVAALGYTPDSLQGTWPANYVTKAKSLGILDGVQAGSAGANRGDIAIMLYQTLNLGIGKVNKDGDWTLNATKDVAGNVTWYDCMLDRLGAELYVPAGLEAGDAFVLDDDQADDAVANVRDYVGAYVTAYANDDQEIIAVKDVKSSFVTGDFDGNDTFTIDDVDYDVTKIGYKDDDDNEQNADYFLNGGYQGTITYAGITDGDEYTLAVNLSGKKIKEIYSVSEWDVDDADYFDSADAADISEDNELFGFEFKENDNKEIDTTSFELIGVDSLDEIKADNVVYVYENPRTDKISRVAVGTEVVTGEISKINSDGDKYTVNGTTYTVSDDATSFSAPSAGDEVTLYLDAYGKVYDCDSAGTKAYAVVVRTADGGTGLGDSDAQVELVLADGNTAVFDLDKDIPGYTTTGGTTVTVSNLAAQDIIKYHVDKDGVIDDIEKMTVTTKAGISITSKGTYDGKTIATDAVLFTYDGDDVTDADNYGVTTYEKALGSDEVSASYVYDRDDKKIVAMLISDYTTTEDVFAVFTGWASVSGDYDYTVDMLIDGKTVTENATKAGKDLAAANIDSVDPVYILKYDASGAVKGGDLVSADGSGDYAVTSVAAIATASAIDGNVVTVSGNDYTLDSDAVVYKWNADDNCYEVGKTRDLKGLTTGTTLYFYSVNGDDTAIYDIVVFK